MKRISAELALLSLIACTFTVMAQESRTTSARAKDEAAIRENVKQMESRWNAKSGESFAEPFAEDADFVIINGMHIRGHDAIENNHQQIFSTIYKNTIVSLTVTQIRFLRPDVALVHVRGHRDATGVGARVSGGRDDGDGNDEGRRQMEDRLVSEHEGHRPPAK